MPSETIAIVKAHKYFYRDNFRKIVTILLGCMLIIIVEIAAIVFLALSRPDAKFYVSSTIGTLTPVYPAKWGARLPELKQEK